jgi:hypothetical protein
VHHEAAATGALVLRFAITVPIRCRSCETQY